MTFAGLFSREPAKRASSLYHLGQEVSHKANQADLNRDQNNVVSIFLHEVKRAHNSAKRECGYGDRKEA